LLRKTIKARLASLIPETLTAAGVAAARHLERIPRWDCVSPVLAFVSMKDEIDTSPIIEAAQKAGKSLFTPRIEGETMTFYPIAPLSSSSLSSPFRVPSASSADPSSSSSSPFRVPSVCSVDPILIFTPGLAFDRSLRRLGRGKGYYDRFFATLDDAGQAYTAVGLCLDCQLVDEVPVCSWDRDMDLLLTESGVLYYN